MALVLKDRVRQTSTTAGTGTITLSGSVTGYQDFTVIGTGNTTYYTIADQSGANWEVGLGTFTSPNQLSRDTVYESSNSNALVNFSSGTKDVFVTLPAEAIGGGSITGSGTTNYVTKFTGPSAIGNSVIYDNGANVGIGTTFPSYKLMIAGTAGVVNPLLLVGISGVSNGFTINADASNDLTYSFLTGSAGTQGLYQNTLGNVGIGHTNPSGKLDVFSGSTAPAIFSRFTSSNGTVMNSPECLQLYNTDATNGNFTNIGFYDATGNIITEINSINENHTTHTGSLTFATRNAGSYGERMRIDSSGNVGIGTSSPATNSLTIARGAGINAAVEIAGNGNTPGTTGFTLQQAGDSVAYIYNRAGQPLIFGTNNIGRMHIDATGNVGIGTSSPTTKLDVGGAGSLIHLYRASDGSGTGYIGSRSGGGYGIYNSGGATSEVVVEGSYITINTAATERMRIDSTGNVGIGTNSPTTKLDLGTNFYSGTPTTLTQAINKISLYENAGVPKYGLGISSGLLNIVGGESTGGIAFRTGGVSERMRIDSAGNVGIGVVPSAWGSGVKAIDVDTVGGFVSSNAATEVYLNSYYDGAAFRYKTTGTASKYEQSIGRHIWYTAASGTAGATFGYTEVMRIDSSGNVGINTSSPGAKLEVNGRVLISNPAVGNWGSGVIECVDDGLGDGYNDLIIYGSDGTTAYAPFFNAGIASANFVIRSQDWTTNYKYVTLQVPSGMSANYTLTLPNTAGSNKQVLKTDGSGNLSWTTIDPLTLTGISDPSAPTGTNTTVYSKSFGGYPTLAARNALNTSFGLQSALWSKNFQLWTTTATINGLWINATGTGNGNYTNTNPTAAATVYQSCRRSVYANLITTTNQLLGVANGQGCWFRGSTAGLGGYFYYARVGFDVWTNGGRFFAGMATSTTVVTAGDPSTSNNSVGFCVDAADNGAISFLTRGTTAATKASTGLTITSNKGYDCYIYCSPNSSQYTWQIIDINTGTSASGTATANLPSNTIMLASEALASNAALTTADAIKIGVCKVYVESDN